MANLIIPDCQAKLKSVQYNTVLAIIGAIRGTSKLKLYQELGLESLRWVRRMYYLQNIISTKLPPYFYEIIPPLHRFHRSHPYPGCFKTLRRRTELFRNSLLPFTVNEWNKLDSDIKNIDSYAIFCNKLLAFIRPERSSICRINDPFRARFINRL